ncbi:uncharacterized protein LOC134092789 [Sardina pilchardus]|uniref:uncharacterized protein LOC134092789 n=1 Tax=Sardina pilchardus TaxID=27697 RepID=UPI002E128B7D
MVDNLPEFIGGVGGALGGFASVPGAVGLGAFVLSTILQLAFINVKASQDSPLDMLQRVFAEEKSSEVRNLMDEYLKRYRMHLRDERRLLADSERLETLLSLQLTRLRNSILVDGQMSSRAVKHWVNGAVFHTETLLHIGRLRRGTVAGVEGSESAKRAASSAADTYYKDMMKILERYKEYKWSTFYLRYRTGICSYEYTWDFCTDCVFTSKTIFIQLLSETVCKISEDDHLQYVLSNHKIFREMKAYFSNVQNNADVLINEKGRFQI